MKHPHYYTRLGLSGNAGLPESNPTIEELDKLDDEELFAILGIKEIMGRAYRKVSPDKCANAQDHMSNVEKEMFKAVLEKHEIIFDGRLGLYPPKKFKLKLKPGAVPIHKKAYPVPFKRQPVFREE